MGVKVRPINENDIKETYGEVKHLMKTASLLGELSVESPDIFGNKRDNKHNGKENTGIYNRRGYIKFTISVLNFFLAGKDAMTISRLLNNRFVKDIAEGRYMFDKVTEKAFDANNIDASKRYTSDILVGGDYLLYLIDKLNIEEEIIKILEEYVVKCLPIKKKKNEEVQLNKYGYISKEKGGIWIIDEYYFEPFIEKEELLEELECMLSRNRSKIIDGYMNRLVLLFGVRNQKDKLKNLIMKNMIVLPIGYRPSIDRRKDPLTKAYNRVVKCNNDLRNLLMYPNTTIENIRLAYRDLISEVKTVTVENITSYDEQYKPILEVLKGKTGLIRDRMHGVRVDYSGRSVIIVDPNMSIDTIGIPKLMAVKLMELGIIQNWKTRSSNKSEAVSSNNEYLRKLKAGELLEGHYAVIGRQPTLYYLGMKAFKVKIVDGDAIVLNPLCTPSFNADFDGDQMHVEVPITKEARKEVSELMASTNNLFLSRSGDCHIGPRQEILYGLWKSICAEKEERSNKYDFSGTIVNYPEILDKICMQKINIYDEVIINEREEIAGVFAFRAILGNKYIKWITNTREKVLEANKRYKGCLEGLLKNLLKDIAITSISDFIRIVNNLTRLGIAIANIFPPNISILNYPDVSNLISEFDIKISEREEYYNMGFETEEAFTSFYDKEYADLETSIQKMLKAELGNDNGYLDMVISGARGSMSNVIQLFGMKGRVMKNENEAFNAILKHPLVAQLSGLEHFVTAYGSRQGLVDKTVATYEPGYLYRKMSHTTAPMYITSEDCGTLDGLLIDYDFIKQFIPQHLFSELETYNNHLVRDYAVKLLIGRYIVGVDNEILTEEDAIDIYNVHIASVEKGKFRKKSGVKMRSPITCKNPCCVKCYGKDLVTNAKAVRGLPIGYIAAQSIGEPGTQLTMKNFQSGGVAGVTNLTSSFDKMSDYLHIYDLKKGNSSKPISYDYITPLAGDIQTVSRGDGTKELKIMSLNNKGRMVNKLRSKVVLYEDIQLKSHVEVGDSIQVIQGDLNIKELLEYRTPEYAQRYLALMLYDIFQKEVYVSLKHFEVLVASMTFYVCMKGNDYFKIGSYYTIQEYRNNDKKGCKFRKTIKGIGDVPLYRTDLFSTIFMEDIAKGIRRSIITSGYDTLTNPLIRTAFGLNLGIGSDIEGYLEKRGRM